MIMRSLQLIGTVLLFILCTAPATGQGSRQIANRRIIQVSTRTTDSRKAKVSQEFTVDRYDRKGNLIESMVFDRDSVKTSWEKFTYTKKNLVREYVVLHPLTGVPEKITEYAYDKWKNETREQVFDGEHRLKQASVSEYDNFGKKVREVTSDAEGKLVRKTVYEYDSRGMLLRRRMFDANGTMIYEKVNSYIY